RPWIHAMQAIPSTFHQCIKLKHEGHTITIQGDLEPFTHCRALNSFARKGTYACPSINIVVPLQSEAMESWVDSDSLSSCAH
ncbi:hypothetical protein KI387_013510, partial [Taxus chinensis]